MIFGRRQLVCQQAVELMTDYLEGSLTSRDRKRLEAHLAACPFCSNYLAQMRSTIATVGEVKPEGLSQAAQDDLIALFERYSSNQ